jgi:hypothetical protein
MNILRYPNGEDVRLGDIIDIGEGNGPRVRVVIISYLGQVAEGFDIHDWPTLDGILCQEVKSGGLLELSEIDPNEDSLVQRA